MTLKPYAKAVVGFVAPGVLVLGQALVSGDRITWALLGKAAGAAIVTAFAVFAVPNKDPNGQHQNESVQSAPEAYYVLNVPHSADTKADATGYDGGSTRVD